MTVNNQTVEVTYVGDGSQTDFPITFEIIDPSQVKWTPYEGSVVETAPNSGNWVVRFPGPPTGEVRIYRDTPITQETQYNPYDAFPAEAHERALDKLTQIAQELEADKFSLPEGDARYLRLSGGSMTGDIFMESNQIKSVADPTEDGDVANKRWVIASLSDSKGPQGEQGEQGEQGPPGKDGASSYDNPTDSTGYWAISVGTTEQAPPDAEPGWLRFNTDVNLLQWSNQAGGWDTAGTEPKPVINSHTMDSDEIYKSLDVTVTATGREIYSNTEIHIYADGAEVHETGITNLVGSETFDFVIPGSVTNALAIGSSITVRAVDAITNIPSDTYLIGDVYEWKPRLSTYAFPAGQFLKNKSETFTVVGFNFTPSMTAEFFCNSISLGTSAVTDINTEAGTATVELTQSMSENLEAGKSVTVRVRCDDLGGVWSDELYVADVLPEDGVMRSENYYDTSGTYTKSLPYIRKIDIVVQGGGGGGGFINHGANNGGAGGGGATAETLKFNVTNIESATYVVGGGGSLGNTGSRYGGTGGTSSFSCNGLNMEATGGGGGAGGTNNVSYGGGGGGTATGGLTRNMNGYNAQGGSNTSSDYGGNPGCGNEHGGSGRIMSGGAVTTYNSRGGGGLGGDQKSTHSGGAGGFVLIREYS